MAKSKKTEVVVIGSGPGGYSAAFRAADLGKKVILIERYANIGGVCLNVGCIPSKALLHAAKVMDEAQEMGAHGIEFGAPKVDVKKLGAWKDGVVSKLTSGLQGLAKMRKVEIVTGFAEFTGANSLSVKSDGGDITIEFQQAIIAVGSEPVKLPFIPEDDRIIDSTGALQLKKTDGSLLILGGGIIGLEMATVYRALGAKISIVEMQDQLMPGADKDLIAPFHKFVSKHYENIMLETSVTAVEAKKDGLHVTFEGKNAPDSPQVFDQILVAVGRRPNGRAIAADKAGVNVTERGFIESDEQLRTNVSHIFSIGDVRGNPMLAHKAVPEGRVAAEVIAGHKHFFDPKCIPSVAYTDPEVAWVGVTEREAKEKGVKVKAGVFPWMASGRALSINRTEGMTKLIFDADTHRIVGAGIVGPNAGELISEIALAIEMGCDVEDIALTIHPHPTLSESVMMAAEVFEGTATDLPPSKKAKGK